MKSIRTKGFKKLYSELPNEIKENAKKQYKLFKKNPNYPSLRTKMIGSTKNDQSKIGFWSNDFLEEVSNK